MRIYGPHKLPFSHMLHAANIELQGHFGKNRKHSFLLTFKSYRDLLQRHSIETHSEYDLRTSHCTKDKVFC